MEMRWWQFAQNTNRKYEKQKNQDEPWKPCLFNEYLKKDKQPVDNRCREYRNAKSLLNFTRLLEGIGDRIYQICL